MGKGKISPEVMERILSKTFFSKEEVEWLQKIGAQPVMNQPNEWRVELKKNNYSMRFIVVSPHALNNSYSCIFYVYDNPVRINGKSLLEVVNAAIDKYNQIIAELQSNVATVMKLVEKYK